MKPNYNGEKRRRELDKKKKREEKAQKMKERKEQKLTGEGEAQEGDSEGDLETEETTDTEET